MFQNLCSLIFVEFWFFLNFLFLYVTVCNVLKWFISDFDNDSFGSYYPENLSSKGDDSPFSSSWLTMGVSENWWVIFSEWMNRNWFLDLPDMDLNHINSIWKNIMNLSKKGKSFWSRIHAPLRPLTDRSELIGNFLFARFEIEIIISEPT